MSEPVQLPPPAWVVPHITPVRARDSVEPAKESQTENRDASERRPDGEQGQPRSEPVTERHFIITRDSVLRSFVYRSIDMESGEVVWQWPAEQVLRRAHHLHALAEKQRQWLDAAG
jgi:hypothetical protein